MAVLLWALMAKSLASQIGHQTETGHLIRPNQERPQPGLREYLIVLGVPDLVGHRFHALYQADITRETYLLWSNCHRTDLGFQLGCDT